MEIKGRWSPKSVKMAGPVVDSEQCPNSQGCHKKTSRRRPCSDVRHIAIIDVWPDESMRANSAQKTPPRSRFCINYLSEPSSSRQRRPWCNDFTISVSVDPTGDDCSMADIHTLRVPSAGITITSVSWNPRRIISTRSATINTHTSTLSWVYVKWFSTELGSTTSWSRPIF